MATVLYINAIDKPQQESFTLRTSNAFLEAYKAANPNDTIEVVDLYSEHISFLTHDDVTKMFEGNPDSKALPYAKQFAQADKYILAAPMWNFGLPAIVKAYIDYVVAKGITFQYTPEGPQGLLKGQHKKAILINARGGDYSNPPWNAYDFTTPYITAIFGFMGIEDMSSVLVSKTAMVGPQEQETQLTEAIEHAKNIAATW